MTAAEQGISAAGQGIRSRDIGAAHWRRTLAEDVSGHLILYFKPIPTKCQEHFLDLFPTYVVATTLHQPSLSRNSGSSFGGLIRIIERGSCLPSPEGP